MKALIEGMEIFDLETYIPRESNSKVDNGSSKIWRGTKRVRAFPFSFSCFVSPKDDLKVSFNNAKREREKER